MSTPRVLAFGAWDRGAGYPRGTSLIETLRQSGVDVVEEHFELPFAGRSKRKLLGSPWLWPGYWLAQRRLRRWARGRFVELVRQYSPDAVLVPYPGHVVAPWLEGLYEGPVVLDLFLSAYDTVVLDRRMFPRWTPMASLLRRLDRRACRSASRVLVDTQANVGFIARLTGEPIDKFAVVPISDPDAPAMATECCACPPGHLELLFFGTGVPLHGLGTLLDAMSRTAKVRLTLIGGTDRDRHRAARLPRERVRVLSEFVTTEELRTEIRRTHLVAGVFGTSDKADRVVPFKLVHAFAEGRPVITASTTAITQLDLPVFRVPAGDPAALASELERIARDPSLLPPLGRQARATYDLRFSTEAVAAPLLRACGLSEASARTPESVEVGA